MRETSSGGAQGTQNAEAPRQFLRRIRSIQAYLCSSAYSGITLPERKVMCQSTRLDGENQPTLVTRDMVEFAIALMNGSGPAFVRMALMNPEKQRKTLSKLTRR